MGAWNPANRPQPTARIAHGSGFSRSCPRPTRGADRSHPRTVHVSRPAASGRDAAVPGGGSPTTSRQGLWSRMMVGAGATRGPGTICRTGAVGR
ncbi:MAG TPA: hypothetical protein VGC99_28480, partial [Candidatus Tectomicrobia bacterium]